MEEDSNFIAFPSAELPGVSHDARITMHQIDVDDDYWCGWIWQVPEDEKEEFFDFDFA